MLTLLLLASMGQIKAQPLDAFQSNYAAIHVDLEFELTTGQISRGAIPPEGLWEMTGLDPEEGRPSSLVGRWECDGEAEHIVIRPKPEAQGERGEGPGIGSISPYNFPYEVLFDGETAAHHILDGGGGGALLVAVESQSPLLQRSPFLWFWHAPFPAGLRFDFPDTEPIHRRAIRDRRPVEVAVYDKVVPEGARVYVEIDYDPNIGYLPMYARMMVADSRRKAGITKEYFLADSRICAAGGHVPTEWYELMYEVHDYPAGFPDYSDGTMVEHADRKVGMTHFRVTKLEDRTGPLRLDQLDDVQVINGPGGIVPLKNRPQTLTLDEVKSILGRNLDPIQRGLPSLDTEELGEFSRRPRTYWSGILVAGLVLLGAGAALIAWRRYRFATLLLLGLTAASGCGGAVEPSARLTASFAPPRFVYDPGEVWLPTTLVLENAGNQAVRVLGLDGGCSCRQPDRTRFPADLEPGETLPVPIRMQDRRQYDAQNYLFTVDTDHGSMRVMAPLHALPRHQLSPESIALHTLWESGDSEEVIRVTHREIFEESDDRADIKLLVPREFRAEQVSTDTGSVGGLPGVSFRDTVYALTLIDRTLGSHKAILGLGTEDGGSLVETPILWSRLGYLSSSPERVILGPVPCGPSCAAQTRRSS